MPKLISTPDDFQNDISARNSELAQLLNGAWNQEPIETIAREALPDQGASKGRWTADWQ